MRAVRGLILAAVLAAAAPALQGATWWRLPVWGAEVRVFAVDPFRAGTLYCGTSRGNFYASADGGESWESLRQGPAFPGYIVTSLIADPRVADRLWASLAGQYAGGLVARSDDRGANWTVLARWKTTVATRALALAPTGAPLLAVGGDDGVRLSRDGGITWTPTGEGTDGLYQVESLAFDPKDPATLYAGTWRQAFRTRDGGATWKRIAEGMVLDATVYSWDFDRKNAADIWVSTCGWVYRTEDGGDHWVRFKTGFTNRRSHNVRRDPTRSRVVYAGTVGGLHRSLDSGQNWSRVSRESLVVTALEVDPRSGRLFVGTEGEGAFYSDDAGTTLRRGSAGLAEGRVADLVADPNDPTRVYFFRAYGGEESGVWEAQGLKVRRVSRDPLPASASLAAFRDEKGKTVLMLASSGGVRVSRDGGERWASPERHPAGAPVALFGAPFPRPVLVTTEGVFSSMDGARFTSLPGSPDDVTWAQLMLDASGQAVLELKTAQGAVVRWNGEGWSGKRRGVLSGGVFLDDGSGSVAAYSSIQDVGGMLVWEEGGKRRSVTSPRPGLALATAAAVPGGRIYIGTTGDGLFLFEP